MSAAAQVAMGMPKIIGLLACGPATVLVGMQGSRIYRNFTATDEDRIVDGGVQKESVARRLIDGRNQEGLYLNDKYVERHLRTNSALKRHADEIRATRKAMPHMQIDETVAKRTSSVHFRPTPAMQRLSVCALAVVLLGGADAGRLRLRSGEDDCGKGFDNLNEGSKKYFLTTDKALWVHPGRTEEFGIFEQELKCWFSHMLTTKCGNLESQAASRKKDLHAVCTDVEQGWMPVWNMFSTKEVDWFKRTYPNDAEDSFATADFREAANTAMELNKKEMLCFTLFVIDDNCVDSMYIRTE